MAWELIFWLLCFCINIALLAMNFYQLIILSDLEADHMNLYEASSRVNGMIFYEFLLQGVFCGLFLVTWHWLMFLLTLPLTCYNVMLFMKRQHLIDVTEAFRYLKGELRCRWYKLFYYLFTFFIVIFRITLSIFNSLSDDAEYPQLLLTYGKHKT